MNKCEKTITRKTWRNHYKYKCGKGSNWQDESGRLLCTKHFKAWFKKKYKISYDEFIREDSNSA